MDTELPGESELTSPAHTAPFLDQDGNSRTERRQNKVDNILLGANDRRKNPGTSTIQDESMYPHETRIPQDVPIDLYQERMGTQLQVMMVMTQDGNLDCSSWVLRYSEPFSVLWENGEREIEKIIMGIQLIEAMTPSDLGENISHPNDWIEKYGQPFSALWEKGDRNNLEKMVLELQLFEMMAASSGISGAEWVQKYSKWYSFLWNEGISDPSTLLSYLTTRTTPTIH